MKEIKAYIRPGFVDRVVEALEKAGAKDMTVVRADALGPLADIGADQHHFIRKYTDKYSTAAKLELVCRQENVARFVETIRSHAHTGQLGDGRIFVTSVEQAVNIRSGETGAEAL